MLRGPPVVSSWSGPPNKGMALSERGHLGGDCSAPAGIIQSHSAVNADRFVRLSYNLIAGLAVYEESQRGSLGSECFNHLGYACSPADVSRIRELIKRTRCRRSGTDGARA